MMDTKRRSTENTVVVEMVTARGLTGKEAAQLVDKALRNRLEFEAVKAKEYKRVIGKLLQGRSKS